MVTVVTVACRVCGGATRPFHHVERVPTQTCVLLDDRAAAAAHPTGAIELAVCADCGFIQNNRFDPGLVDYRLPTEESQAFSGRFTAFATALAADLDARHDLAGRDVLEIGCGKGDFLRLLAEHGVASAVGIDPGYLPNRPSDPEQVQVLRQHYDGDTALTADLVLTRHVLEHVDEVATFLGWLRRTVAARPGAALVSEVPDTGRVLAEGAFWDVYYEHCSYFTVASLRVAHERAGFEVTWERSVFDDQYLVLGARPAAGRRTSAAAQDAAAEQVATAVDAFTTRVAAGIDHWTTRVAEAGGRVALWGGGSKAVALLGAVPVEDPVVVDINPHKQGRWLPGVAVEVQSPDVLAQDPPALVVVMNPVYEQEIRADLADRGITTVVAALR